MKHIIDLGDLSHEEFDGIYKLAEDIIESPENYIDACKGKVLGSLFFEPSTRTNLSFSAAMKRLGGSVIGFSDPNTSSAAKGESLKDTIKMVAGYSDILVMRNPKEGSALAASLYSKKPIINAGDGGHFHPTQTLADMITILKLRKSADNMTIGLCGDLKYGRTVHSLIKFLARYKNLKVILISPEELRVPKYIKSFMVENNIYFEEVTNLQEHLPRLDVLYMTRIQRERFEDGSEYEKLKDVYILRKKHLERAKKELLILHPLPRVDEIADDVDDDPRAVYFKQAEYGMYGRMALILTLLNGGEIKPKQYDIKERSTYCLNPNCITRGESYLPELLKEVNGETICVYCDKEVRDR